MSQDYTDDELREMDEQVQQAHDERVQKYLAGDAINKYMDLKMKPARFENLRIGELFVFTRSPVFDSPRLHKKVTNTFALREDGQQIQFYPDWWTGSYR